MWRFKQWKLNHKKIPCLLNNLSFRAQHTRHSLQATSATRPRWTRCCKWWAGSLWPRWPKGWPWLTAPASARPTCWTCWRWRRSPRRISSSRDEVCTYFLSLTCRKNNNRLQSEHEAGREFIGTILETKNSAHWEVESPYMYLNYAYRRFRPCFDTSSSLRRTYGIREYRYAMISSWTSSFISNITWVRYCNEESPNKSSFLTHSDGRVGLLDPPASHSYAEGPQTGSGSRRRVGAVPASDCNY